MVLSSLLLSYLQKKVQKNKNNLFYIFKIFGCSSSQPEQVYLAQWWYFQPHMMYVAEKRFRVRISLRTQ